MKRTGIFNPAALKLFALLIAAGLVLTFLHDYTYRRADVTGTGDYVGGLVSHAGTDMLIVTAVLAVVAVLWTNRRGHDSGA